MSACATGLRSICVALTVPVSIAGLSQWSEVVSCIALGAGVRTYGSLHASYSSGLLVTLPLAAGVDSFGVRSLIVIVP